MPERKPISLHLIMLQSFLAIAKKISPKTCEAKLIDNITQSASG